MEQLQVAPAALFLFTSRHLLQERPGAQVCFLKSILWSVRDHDQGLLIGPVLTVLGLISRKIKSFTFSVRNLLTVHCNNMLDKNLHKFDTQAVPELIHPPAEPETHNI